MPDLRTDHVTTWLAAALPPPLSNEWPPPIRTIEADADVSPRLAEFGRRLDLLAPDSSTDIAGFLRNGEVQDKLRSILAQMGAARLLRILHWLGEDSGEPGGPPYAPLLAGHSPDATALRASVGALTRSLTLQRIFSRDRLAALQAACADAAKEAI